ncbi:elongation factor P [Petrotoga mexicana DSM 14811]|uniref:Elongation factor P n=1 Tax=Petrotoga mexicana DSM 14811 TaxID=1122954 RepID=A0A2K1PCE1_9BACT|nr:elongation factor P [Petrotoga mexicana]MDK2906128.1 elongation factor [Petrotoga sp.]PNS00436.1 elongation factor P [Petrotoga mexicana DSM 14811]
MIDVGDLRKGNFIVYQNEVYRVVEANKHFMGRGSGLIRTRLKNVMTGLIKEVSFSSGEKVQEADISFRKAQFLYNDGDHYYFMLLDTYEQYSLPAQELEEEKYYLTENLEVDLIFFNGNPISIQLPTVVILTVTDTEPNFKGNTVSGGGKPATLETGLKTTVPFFVERGQKIKVDTRTGDYLERA